MERLQLKTQDGEGAVYKMAPSKQHYAGETKECITRTLLWSSERLEDKERTGEAEEQHCRFMCIQLYEYFHGLVIRNKSWKEWHDMPFAVAVSRYEGS